ncbi:MAG: hypothetical protein D8M59_00525 [Planctomycetes bacterium]|nr:hypothetical protein [Planctomycetota bacterium]
MAVLDEEFLLVTDAGSQSIVKYRISDGEAVQSVAIEGKPLAIGCLDGRVYVGNDETDRIEIYSDRGTYLGALEGTGSAVGSPSDLAIDATDRLMFVVDSKACDVKVFDLDRAGGEMVYTISRKGENADEFQKPTAIAIDPVAKEVFVSDYGDEENASLNPRVLVFSYDGLYQTALSGKGGANGYRYSKPQGLAVNDLGHVFVTDAWFGEICIMDRATGEEVTTLGSYGKEPGQLWLPLDIVITGENKDLYVTNSRVHRIEVFAEGGQN